LFTLHPGETGFAMADAPKARPFLDAKPRKHVNLRGNIYRGASGGRVVPRINCREGGDFPENALFLTRPQDVENPVPRDPGHYSGLLTATKTRPAARAMNDFACYRRERGAG
jgi:hypothetical protein